MSEHLLKLRQTLWLEIALLHFALVQLQQVFRHLNLTVVSPFWYIYGFLAEYMVIFSDYIDRAVTKLSCSSTETLDIITAVISPSRQWDFSYL